MRIVLSFAGAILLAIILLFTWATVADAIDDIRSRSEGWQFTAYMGVAIPVLSIVLYFLLPELP